jgi:hypothetical protein
MSAAIAIDLRAWPALGPVIFDSILMKHGYFKILRVKTALANLDSRNRGIILFAKQ